MRFYNFRGLSEFKTKFHPEHWQPVVVIVKDHHFRLRHLRAIGRAFTRAAPELALASGIGRAARAEIATLCSRSAHFMEGEIRSGIYRQ